MRHVVMQSCGRAVVRSCGHAVVLGTLLILKAMISNKNAVLTVLTCILLITSFCSEERSTKKYDVVIYGGTSGGISAAIQTSRMGKSVVLIEPTGDWEDSPPGDLVLPISGINRQLAVFRANFTKTLKTIMPIRQTGNGRAGKNTSRTEMILSRMQCGHLNLQPL